MRRDEREQATEDLSEAQREGRREGQRHARHALLQLIRFNGRQKTFAYRDFSPEAFRYLAELEKDNIIEEVPCDEPLAHTYRLKMKFP